MNDEHVGDEFEDHSEYRDQERLDVGGGVPPGKVMELVAAIEPETPMDQVSAALEAAEVLNEWNRRVQAALRRAVVAWIELHGPVVLGPFEYRAVYSTATRCRDVKKAGHLLLHALNGDFDGLLGHLVSQPYKYGGLRSVLTPELHAQLFAVDRVGRLQKTLRRIDRRFGGGGAS